MRWLPGAAVAVASVVLAVAEPASWWGVTFVAGVLAALLAARPVVRPSYAAGWTRTTVTVTCLAAVAGVTYAFEVGPWGPRPAVYAPVLLVAALVGVGRFASTPGGRRLDRYGSRRQQEDAHGHALRRYPR
ncbi:MAG TPA: hypothetical protein VNA20_01535 [Frankiaceae bacterium]|nr:hypothetical protein [Frankiaceae bacterium]